MLEGGEWDNRAFRVQEKHTGFDRSELKEKHPHRYWNVHCMSIRHTYQQHATDASQEPQTAVAWWKQTTQTQTVVPNDCTQQFHLIKAGSACASAKKERRQCIQKSLTLAFARISSGWYINLSLILPLPSRVSAGTFVWSTCSALVCRYSHKPLCWTYTTESQVAGKQLLIERMPCNYWLIIEDSKRNEHWTNPCLVSRSRLVDRHTEQEW